MTDELWKDSDLHSIGMLIDGRAQPTGVRERGSDATILLLFNGHHEGVGFTLPPTIEGDEWHLLLNTSNNSQEIGKVLVAGDNVEMEERSMAAFVMQRTGTSKSK